MNTFRERIFVFAPSTLEAALAGLGIASLPEDLAQPHITEGRLQLVMEDWCPMLPGQHAHYPSRRQSSRACRSSSKPCAGATKTD